VRAAARSFEVTPSFILAEVTPLPAILYHKDFDRGESARPRAPSRLDGLVYSCRGYTLTEKDGLVYSC